MDLSEYVCYICNEEFNSLGGYALDLQLDKADDENIPCEIRHISCEKKKND